MSKRTKSPRLIWRSRPDVVATVQDQTTQAEHLARIPGQDRLTDPRTNPAVRAVADQLRNEQHRLLLQAEHVRAKRRHRVHDRRAADAELTLEAIQRARQASSPARSVLALHRGRIRFLGAALTASVVLSTGSAAGVNQLAVNLDAPALTGWVAEIGMVGLSTLAILYRAHLSQHGWTAGRAHNWLLWALAVVPLLASVAANALSAGPVGVACSIGAATFGAFAHLIGDASAEALRARAAEVTGDDEDRLRAVALGEALFSAPHAPHAHGGEDRAEPAHAEEPARPHTEPRTETAPHPAPPHRTEAPAQPAHAAAPHTAQDTAPHTDTPAQPARRTATVTPINGARAEWAARIADEIRTARAEGRTWEPDYDNLMARTNFKRRWCEARVAEARTLAARTPHAEPAHPREPHADDGDPERADRTGTDA
ncbi:hypothetical protein [Actinomadura bangladeshensis]|uniref:DUF2637 domain-containing protein n=1 Tax=Actinomadura bangladeshensis TaxID=453573 RepID=A0A6L9QAV3_9ACTN|nr:hypothetical protein [Actinomadura bangladeshensis]NEA22627.1 hypothetical protein [Actinomadura bangladeshensis]